jgi:RimJ/RimL family protein N-acetyltransferase
MSVLKTARLRLRELTTGDAGFMLALLNDPDFIRHVGDRGVRTLEAAREYIVKGPMQSYARNGFGLYMVELSATREKVGICGLVKREGLTDIDIGFGFLPQYRSQGYAIEAATAVMAQARDELGLARVVAITSQDNDRSANVLRKLGFEFEKMIKFPGEDKEIRLFAWPGSESAGVTSEAT